MGTTSEKLTYLNTTKTLIKEELNLGGANITTEPFRQYKAKLEGIYKDFLANGTDTLWNNWEKVNGTGETLSLTPTIKGKMKVDLKGNTSQKSTTGKNKVNFNTNTQQTINDVVFTPVYENGLLKYINANGTASAGINCYLYGNDVTFYSLPAGTYYLSDGASGESSTTYFTYMDVKNNDLLFLSTIATKTRTYSNDIEIRLRIVVRSGVQLNNVKFYPMLESGSSATSYEPYTNGASPNPDYPQDIQVVSGDNSIKVEGKNLFDIGTSNSDYDNIGGSAPTYLTVSGNTLSMTIQSGGSTRFFRKQNLEGNNTFTINSTTSTNEARYFVRIRKLDDSGWMTNSDYTFASGWSYNQYYGGWYINVRGGNNDETFTIPECLYWQIGFGWDTNVYQGTTQTMANIQLEYGSTASTAYIPYQTPTTYPINLPFELCKIGDYQDRIFNSKEYNFFDKDNANVISGYVAKSNAAIYAGGNEYTIYIPCRPNTEYSIKKGLASTSSNNRFRIGTTNSIPSANSVLSQLYAPDDEQTTTTYTFTTNSTANYLVCYLYSAIGSEDFNTLKNSISIMETIPHWYKYSAIGKVVLNGTQNITISNWRATASSVGWIYPYSIINSITSSSIGTTPQIICNKLIPANINDLYNGAVDNGIGLWQDTSYGIVVRTSDTTLTNVSLINTYLSNNPMSVYVPLATPTNTEITDSTLLEQLNNLYNANSYEETTNVSQVNDDMPFILDITALKEI